MALKLNFDVIFCSVRQWEIEKRPKFIYKVQCRVSPRFVYCGTRCLCVLPVLPRKSTRGQNASPQQIVAKKRRMMQGFGETAHERRLSKRKSAKQRAAGIAECRYFSFKLFFFVVERIFVLLKELSSLREFSFTTINL
ncbi:hypothetical protein B9Z55_014192 [Caenorhabditis nigoni]|uniref:Uncharacterized protein n=1 Tax=Caenorhabditis nigoni TaxID=1611254 RepID=A0A2G5U4W1_9PELO|nr:hypothetical protein B9Z55_014192 [Caenorhabditis nigoni]